LTRLIRILNEEAGYSLVEVMAAIVLLAIAIIPLVSLFDAGLKTTTQTGQYDQARALANEQMERVKVLGYAAAAASGTGTYRPPTPACTISLPPGFACQMNTYYLTETEPNLLQRPSSAISSSKVMEIVVRITWDGGNKQYTTTGLKGQGSS
jgi:prepilin-type N-terminal cleavage/methylation domain-containing protein